MTLAGSAAAAEIDESVINLKKLQDALYRYCLAVTGSSWDAEDLAQEAWLKAIGKLQGSAHACPEALLKRIAKNAWIDQTRRKSSLARILQQEQPEAALPEHGLFGIELAFQALNQHMSPLQRTVFILREVVGLSIGETAECLETTEGAVKAALHRARLALKEVQSDLEHDELQIPKEAKEKAFLQALAASYQAGDVAALVKLSLQGRLPDAGHSTVQRVQSRRIQAPNPVLPRKGLSSLMQMAA